MSALPDGWWWSTVAECGSVDLGRQRHPNWHNGPEMHPYLRVANVFEDRIDATDLKVMDFSGGAFERFKLRPGDVLLNEGQTPELLGRPAIYRGVPEDVAFTNSLIRFRAGPDVLPEWALTVFRHYMHAGRFTRESRITTNIAHLSASRFKSVEFPVPPLEEQRRIVEVLEDHLSRLAAALSGVELNAARLDVLRQSLIDDAFEQASDPNAWAFRDALLLRRRQESNTQKAPAAADVELLSDGLPWPIASLEEVTDPARVIRYGILKPASEPGDVPYVEVRDLRGPVLERANLKRTSVELDQQFAGARLRGGDVVVAVRGSFERSAVVPDALTGANVSRDVVRLAPLPGMNPSFVRHWYQSSASKRYLRRHARGVAVRGVNVGTLRAMPIPVVSPDVQDAVIKDIEIRLDSIERMQAGLEQTRRRARSLKRALLAAAFDGSLLSTAGGPGSSDGVEDV